MHRKNNNLRDCKSDGEGRMPPLRTERAIAMSKAFEIIDRFLSLRTSLRRRAKRMDLEGGEIGMKSDFNVDNTTLDQCIDLIQSKTQAIDTYSRELQGYMTLFKEVKIEISQEIAQEDLQDLKRLLLAANATCDDLDEQMLEVVEAMQEMLPT